MNRLSFLNGQVAIDNAEYMARNYFEKACAMQDKLSSVLTFFAGLFVPIIFSFVVLCHSKEFIEGNTTYITNTFLHYFTKSSQFVDVNDKTLLFIFVMCILSIMFVWWYYKLKYREYNMKYMAMVIVKLIDSYEIGGVYLNCVSLQDNILSSLISDTQFSKRIILKLLERLYGKEVESLCSRHEGKFDKLMRKFRNLRIVMIMSLL